MSTARFETVSIKPTRGAVRFGIRDWPLRLIVEDYSIRDLVMLAFNARQHEVVFPSSPVLSSRVDVEATTTVETTFAEKQQMLQAVLRDRLSMRTYREVRQLPVYVLNEGPRRTLGPNLLPIQSDCSVPRACESRILSGHLVGDTTWVQIRAVIQSGLDRMLIDDTGFGGSFNVHLSFARGSLSGSVATEEPVSVFTAVREQLGLSIEPVVRSVPVVVVDAISSPTPN